MGNQSPLNSWVRLSVLLLLLHSSVHAQTPTLFWYTDEADLLPSKTPYKHIMPGKGDYGTKDAPISPTELKEGQKAIDIIRGSAVPEGSNINKATWDPTLEQIATSAANRCDGSGVNGTHAEIMVASTARLSFRDALMMLKAQGAAYNYDTNQCATDPCLQYKLLMSSNITSFACSRAHCLDIALPYRVHCILAPKPSVDLATEKPYIRGTPCQLCPPGYCYNNLCVSREAKEGIIRENPNAIIIAQSGTNPNSTGGPCERQGTPCKNHGMEPLDSTNCTACLCPRHFKGRFCDIPDNGYTGGIIVPIVGPTIPCTGTGCPITTPVDIGDLWKILEDIKGTIATEINNFCKQSQANYIKCCGFGTLPTSGATDFVSASDVKTFQKAQFDAAGRLMAPIYVDTRGNNGLCRKTTDDPSPIVPVPPEVLAEVINSKAPDLKASCCNAEIKVPVGTVKDNLGSGGGGGGGDGGGFQTDISVLTVQVG